MFKQLRLACIILGLVALAASSAFANDTNAREYRVSSGGTLQLDLEAGGTVSVTGTGGSSVVIEYTISSDTSNGFEVDFDETRDGVRVITRYRGRSRDYTSGAKFHIAVPRDFNIQLDSLGGGLSVEGVDGSFKGKTMGGELTLHDVHGTVSLTTMGGGIRVTESELDGSVKTMGGEVLIEDVIGDVKGSSNGGNVRYRNVQRRDGRIASPARTGGHADATGETVQISTMGGRIDIDDAPEGADLHTMGGNIMVGDAQRFVRAKTMGGDIQIDAVDGWLEATTMGGDIDATLVGRGGEVNLVSMSGYITLHVPAEASFDYDLEIAYTRSSRQKYEIDTPFELEQTRTSEWDHGHGSPRKYIRMSGSVGSGGEKITIRTINGNIRIVEGR